MLLRSWLWSWLVKDANWAARQNTRSFRDKRRGRTCSLILDRSPLRRSPGGKVAASKRSTWWALLIMRARPCHGQGQGHGHGHGGVKGGRTGVAVDHSTETLQNVDLVSKRRRRALWHGISAFWTSTLLAQRASKAACGPSGAKTKLSMHGSDRQPSSKARRWKLFLGSSTRTDGRNGRPRLRVGLVPASRRPFPHGERRHRGDAAVRCQGQMGEHRSVGYGECSKPS